MFNSLAPVVSFNDYTASAFLEWIQRPWHVNRFRMSYEHKTRLTRVTPSRATPPPEPLRFT